MFRQREQRCWGNPGEATCVNLYRVTDKDAPEDKIELVDENGKFYNSCFTFKECTPINKTMADCFKRRVVCKIRTTNRELLGNT